MRIFRHDDPGFAAALQSLNRSATPAPHVAEIEAVRLYIQTQEDHHRRRTFREAYVELLTRSGVAYDERHLD